MYCYPNSFINNQGECILVPKGNVYFIANDCESKKDVVRKLLMWTSRAMDKGRPYVSEKRNKDYRQAIIDSFNKYLKTDFSTSDIEIIYQKLGSGVNPTLCDEFIECEFDINVLKENE
jgi:hypothetical protein